MNFLDDSLLPESEEMLVIQVAPIAPQRGPGASDDISATPHRQTTLQEQT